MKVYESLGVFDDVKKEFNLSVQLTDIGRDTFLINKWYDISDSARYAIVGILQTTDGNDKDLSSAPANFTFEVSNVPFSSIDQFYRTDEDKDINKVIKGEVITIIVHHGIGFDPKTNVYDNLFLENYKAGALPILSKGSPPGAGGKGIIH
jgi:hypothetical protein